MLWHRYCFYCCDPNVVKYNSCYKSCILSSASLKNINVVLACFLLQRRLAFIWILIRIRGMSFYIWSSIWSIIFFMGRFLSSFCEHLIALLPKLQQLHSTFFVLQVSQNNLVRDVWFLRWYSQLFPPSEFIMILLTAVIQYEYLSAPQKRW